MASIIVSINMGDESAEELKNYIEKNKKEYFPVGGNYISVDKVHLKTDPTENDFYLFNLLGIIDDEGIKK